MYICRLAVLDEGRRGEFFVTAVDNASGVLAGLVGHIKVHLSVVNWLLALNSRAMSASISLSTSVQLSPIVDRVSVILRIGPTSACFPHQDQLSSSRK
jgi:hypothetical protein